MGRIEISCIFPSKGHALDVWSLRNLEECIIQDAPSRAKSSTSTTKNTCLAFLER